MQVQSESPLTNASVNDPPVEEKSLLSSSLSFNHAVYERQHVAEEAACLCACLCVRTALQSGCLFLAGGCKLINFDRLPLRPTANTSSTQSRHFHRRSVFFGCFLSRFLSCSPTKIQIKLRHCDYNRPTA